MRSFLTLATAFAAAVVALPASNAPHVMHEKRSEAAPVWVKRSVAPASARLPVRIGLTQSNLEAGHNRLMEISTHNSPSYGQHMTADEVADFFAPSAKTVDAVSEWLQSAGISDFSQSANKQWMQLDLNVEELESLLKTKYHEWEHTDSGDLHVACDEYHIPEHLVDHVDYITPGVKLFAGARKAKRASERTLTKRNYALPPLMSALPSGVVDADVSAPSPTNINQCDRVVEPQCIRALYNISKATTAAPNNYLGIFEDLNDIYDQYDLNLLYKTTSPNIPKGTHPIHNPIDGAPGPVNVTYGGGESLLDLSITIPLIYPQKVVLFQTDDAPYESYYNYSGFLNNFFDAIDGSYCTLSMYGEKGNSPLDPPYPDPRPGGYKKKLQCGKYNATNVISISYGGQEYGLPVAYQRRQCFEMMKLGMQGVTIVVSSGDSGVGEARGTNIANCLGKSGKIFSPDFPASCPYLTAAGSTYLPRGSNVLIDAERATDRFPSGGGFSNIYSTPSYQQSAVTNWLNKYNNFSSYAINETLIPTAAQAGTGIFNSAGRGYPDIGALGDNVFIYYDGKPYVLGGTSASSPTFAGIITRINEVRILAGKKPVGFVNPTLYAHPEAFNDILVGSNPNCASTGFLCAPGWDPVTGLGTPNYPKLLSIFSALP